jgi:hypothetical protein
VTSPTRIIFQRAVPPGLERTCRDAGLTARLEDLHGPTVRSDPDVRLGLDVAAATSDAARVSGGELHATHVPNSSSVSLVPDVAAVTLRANIRSRP